MMIQFKRILSQRNLIDANIWDLIYANILCQVLGGRNKNQFFHYFSLLRNLLHHQDLPNKWFERRLKRMAPTNIRLDEDFLKTSFVFIFRRRLQDVLIKTNMFALALRLQKTSSRRLQDVLVKTNIFVLAIRLQDVFKTSCKNVFKTSSRRLQGVLKTSSKRLQDVLQRYLQDVFKTYHQVKLFLLTRLREAFNTFLRCIAKMVIYRGICLSDTSEKFMASVQNL